MLLYLSDGQKAVDLKRLVWRLRNALLVCMEFMRMTFLEDVAVLKRVCCSHKHYFPVQAGPPQAEQQLQE